MKNVRPLCLAGIALLLSGCSTLSEVHWSKMAPWNWFGGGIKVTEQGIGGITATTPLSDDAIADGLNDDYRLRSGMRMHSGKLSKYYEAMKQDALALVISGENGSIRRIDVMDKEIESEAGVKIGAPFSDVYARAYGACQPGNDDDARLVVCAAPDSQHIYYGFSGAWRGPEGLMPSDDTLKNWTLKKIIWQQ